ncbi:MAG: TonB-dependent receptor [Gemmatimonadaceae bacterium]
MLPVTPLPADTLRPKQDSAAKGDSLAAREPIAQDTLKARRDSLRADSLRADSLQKEAEAILREQARRVDTIKAPTAAAEMPKLTDLGEQYRWGRDELAATGALTLGDLLDRVPGLTVFRSGWLGSPQVGAMMGDISRVRVFYDGIELDNLDPRNGGVLDLSFVQLWQLEEVRIERAAAEVRVHLRSWRVRSVTPSTRIDIGTGDLETNGYGGYFGQRYRNGAALQLGAYQIGTRDNRGSGDADGLSLFGRTGWARGRLSFDASFLRTARDRTEQPRDEELIPTRPPLAKFDGSFTQAYARAAFTDTARGIWVHLTAARLSHKQTNIYHTDTVDFPLKPSPTEFTPSAQQYIAAAGWERGPLSLSFTGRYRRIDSLSYLTPSARLSFERPRLALTGFVEQQAERHLRRIDGSARLLPLSWIGLSGAVSYYAPTTAGLFPTQLTYRGELGIRLRRAWLSGGIMSRDTAQLIAPIVFDTGFTGTSVGATTGMFVSLRGKVWKDVGFDATAIKWDSAGMLRPMYQTRSQLYVNTAWRSRFPSGNLNIYFAVSHEYRTQALFLVGDEVLQSTQYRTIGAQLEIRLLQATLTYQFRNLLNEVHQQVPGFFMHRPVQFYGVRWYFFN